MRLIICCVILISCASNTGNKQNKAVRSPESTIANDSTEYLDRAVAFLKEVNAIDSKAQPFILVSKPFQFEYFECLDELFKDSADISIEEMRRMKSDIKKSYINTWSDDLLPGVKIVSSKTIDSIFNNRKSDGWQVFYKSQGSSFSSLSAPYFFRNGECCLFYQDTHCGWLCGSGNLSFYKQENGRWVKIKSYCNWIS